jgi:BirA family transcriptional regulator, biotin operon repressor / biotin---[acetyl-CoA-carboxylase] ligase
VPQASQSPGSTALSTSPQALPLWLHWLDQCPSTNTWASEQAAKLNHGDVVFTQRQTAGRGQHGRTWFSAAGVLTTSIVLDHFHPSQLSAISLVAGLAVINAVEALMPAQRDSLRLKWMNDIYAQDRKLAGILCQTTLSHNSTQARVIVGIGLNHQVNFEQAGLTSAQIGQAISLHQLSAPVPEELLLLECLRDYLMQVANVLSKTTAGELDVFLPELRDRDLLLNRSIQFSTADETFSGQAVGIDTIGRLLIQLPNGEVKAFSSGRVINWQPIGAKQA